MIDLLEKEAYEMRHRRPTQGSGKAGMQGSGTLASSQSIIFGGPSSFPSRQEQMVSGSGANWGEGGGSMKVKGNGEAEHKGILKDFGNGKERAMSKDSTPPISKYR